VVGIVGGVDSRSVAGGFAVYRASAGLTEHAAAIIEDDGVSPSPAVTLWSRSTPGERRAAGDLGEPGLFGRPAPGACQVTMLAFSLNTTHRKGDRFAFGLFCRLVAVVNVVLLANGFDSGAIGQGPFDPQGCVWKRRGRARETLTACALLQVFVRSVRFVGRPGVPGHTDVV
jgi:hypothetical protein